MVRRELIVRKREEIESEIMKAVRDVMGTINHGSLTLVIQDGKVLQIDRTEKIRIN